MPIKTRLLTGRRPRPFSVSWLPGCWRTILPAGWLGLLVACGGDSSEPLVDISGAPALQFSYPYDGQVAVSPNAPVVLRFSDALTATADQFSLLECAAGASRCDDGDKVATVALAAPQSTGQGRGVVLWPEQGPLKTGTTYSLVFNGLRIQGETVVAPRGSLAFTTRVAKQGALSEQMPQAALAVQQLSPGEGMPMLDFSTLRVRFNQPLDESTAVYGETVSLRSEGQLVPAALWVQGTSLAVDPRQELVPGHRYTLEIQPGLSGIGGDGLDNPWSRQWLAQDTRPRATLALQAAAANDCALPAPSSTSMLTGEAINCVPLLARLLGDTTVARQSGDVFAELAHTPNFPEVTPLRIPRGSLLKGDPLAVRIGGQVDAGFDSGEVTVTFLSDATGYLIPNPYSDSDTAPRHLRLSIDVAFAMDEPRANGAFTQQLVQVELVGTALVNPETGRLVTDAVGVVEPEVLGLETAVGMLGFHMESYPDQRNAPVPHQDRVAPALQAWQPGDAPAMQRPGDPLVLNFSEPLDPASIQAAGAAEDNLQLSRDGQPEPFHWQLDGAALTLVPDSPLVFGAEYTVQVFDTVTDLAGNGVIPETLSFTMPDFDPAAPRAPLVLTSYPGFPCNTVERSLANNSAGRCLGGSDGSASPPDGAAPVVEDDHLPLAVLPLNRDIRVTFSQPIDPQSVTAATVVVEAVNASGVPQGGPIAGSLQVNGRQLTFTPAAPLTAGALYRYTLFSVLGNPSCGVDAICDVRGLPLQTRLLYEGASFFPAPEDGGAPLQIYFRAGGASGNVLQTLRNLPAADVNANLLREASEAAPSIQPTAALNSARLAKASPSAQGQLIADFDIGCPSEQYEVPDLSLFPALEAKYSHLYTDMPSAPCPDNHYLYLTGNLEADIVGHLSREQVLEQFGDDPLIPQTVKDNGGVLAYINPTRIVTSGTTVYPILTEIAKQLTNAVLPAPTGPQLMRIRYRCDANPTAANPCPPEADPRVPGWIINGTEGPAFVTRLTLYLDAPQLEPVAILAGAEQTFTHNLHSYPLTLELAGELAFLDDGRLSITQLSTQALPVDVYLGGMVADLVVGTDAIHMTIPVGETVLHYLSNPIKP